MLYELPCPDCGSINIIDADKPHLSWACDYCNARAESTLATADDDYSKLIQQGGE